MKLYLPLRQEVEKKECDVPSEYFINHILNVAGKLTFQINYIYVIHVLTSRRVHEFYESNLFEIEKDTLKVHTLKRRVKYFE